MNSVEGRWNLAALGALMSAALAVHLFVPLPKVDALVRKHKTDESRLVREAAKLRDEVKDTREYVQSKLWKSGPDALGAEAMSVVDVVAKKNGVTVQAFRPQRTVTAEGIVRYPYSVVVQGSFPKVLQLVRELQDPGTLLAVTSVQLSSADGASDSVTATVGLAAFLESVEVKTNGK
jgi:Tfp pilus assembly protein PilO